ncbi:uncharacterized protein LOC131948901 [Physella acuta]|uniref:uncharacterized protein LOC131948901 n=1 Tax=Physella acuta TaxID=109671 RepID=UPI0027DD8294|nr:uncharacterized protein LOC131948901 [Physella acuta]
MGCILLCVALKTGDITGNTDVSPSTPSTNSTENSTVSSTVNDYSAVNYTVNDNSTVNSTVNDNITDSSTVNYNSTDSSNINDTSSTSSIANVNDTTTTDESTNVAPTDEYNITEYTTVTTYDTTNDPSCYIQNSTVPTGITLWFPEIEDLNGTLVASFNCTEGGCIVKKNLSLNSTFVAVKKQPWSTNTPCAENIKTILKQTEISEFQNGDTVMFYCAGGTIRRPSGWSLTLSSELNLTCDDMGSWWCELENSTDVLSLNISVRCPIQLTSALNEPTIPVSTYLLYNIPVVGYPLHATFHLLMSEVTCGTRTDVTVADDVYNVSLQTTGDPRSGNVTLRIPVIKDEYLTNWTLLINNSVGKPLVSRFKLVSETGAEHSVSCDDQPDISSIIIIAVPTALAIFIVIVLIVVIVVVVKRKKQTRRANEIRARRFDIVEPEQKSRSRDAESVNFDRQVSLTSFTGSCHSIPADDNFSLDSLSGRNGLHDIDSQGDKQLSPVNSGKFAFHQNNHG